VTAGEAKQITWDQLQTVSSPVVAEKGRRRDEPDGLDAMTPEAKADYLARYVEVGETLQVNVYNQWAAVTNSYSLYRGQYHEKLSEEDFFKLTGRSDLAGKVRQRRGLMVTLIIAASALTVGGIGYAAATRLYQELSGPPAPVKANATITPFASTKGGGLLLVATF
jgi:hypothetical protein